MLGGCTSASRSFESSHEHIPTGYIRMRRVGRILELRGPVTSGSRTYPFCWWQAIINRREFSKQDDEDVSLVSLRTESTLSF